MVEMWLNTICGILICKLPTTGCINLYYKKKVKKKSALSILRRKY